MKRKCKISKSLKQKLKLLGFEKGVYENTYTHPKLTCAIFDFSNTEDDFIEIMSTAFAVTIRQTDELNDERTKQKARALFDAIGLGTCCCDNSKKGGIYA